MISAPLSLSLPAAWKQIGYIGNFLFPVFPSLSLFFLFIFFGISLTAPSPRLPSTATHFICIDKYVSQFEE